MLIQCRLKKLSISNDLYKKYLIPTRYSTFERQRLLNQNTSPSSSLEKITPLTAEWFWKHYEIGSPQKIVLELCCGVGEFLIHAAKTQPKILFIGVDHALACVQRSIKKADAINLKNVLFYCGDAIDFLSKEISMNFFDEIMINFPDPWPKKKHFKRRIVQEKTLAHFHKSLKKKGTLITATDVLTLHRYHLEILKDKKIFKNVLNVKKTNAAPNGLYKSTSSYQAKNLSKSGKTFYTKHQKIN